MWAITPKVRPLKCTCVYELKDTDKTPICRHTHIHAQLRIILGCGPNANLKSTNTHGTQQREKETEQGEASGYYAWTEVLCCYILKCGLGLVTDTTWTAKRLFNWNEVKRSPDGFNRQYSLGGHIPICLSLHLCPGLLLPHIFLRCPYSFTSFESAALSIPQTSLSPFLFHNHYFFIIISIFQRCVPLTSNTEVRGGNDVATELTGTVQVGKPRCF